MRTLPRAPVGAKPPLRPKRLSRSPADAPSALEALRTLYPADRWAVATEVRSSADLGLDVFRRADALAVETYGGGPLKIHGFEVKLSRRDWQRELTQPEKCSPFALCCSAWWLVVPAPWKSVVLSRGELPAMWGMIETNGSRGACIVVQAEEREAEEPSPGFLRALLRAGARGAEATETPAPMQPVLRVLARDRVALVCGHVAPRPLVKGSVPRVPCWACDQDLPTELEAIEAAIDDADPAALERLRARIDARIRRAG